MLTLPIFSMAMNQICLMIKLCICGKIHTTNKDTLMSEVRYTVRSLPVVDKEKVAHESVHM